MKTILGATIMTGKTAESHEQGWTWDETSYWSDWHTDDWGDYDSSWNSDVAYYNDWEEDEIQPVDETDVPEEAQFREAYTIANEAAKTLREAREAVRKVRQSRGYFAPESSSGKGMSPSSASSSSKGWDKGALSKGKFGGKFHSGSGGKPFSKGSGTCLICGRYGHGYMQCPDRFAGGKGKSFGKSGKGKSKKGKGGGKPKGYYFDHYGYYLDLDIHLNILAAQWDAFAAEGRPITRTVLDTGATENAVGLNALQQLIQGGQFSYTVDTSDRPVFRFGNGHKDRAVSRVDLSNTALGTVSFYALDGMACATPPLLGAKTLRQKQAVLSYSNGMFVFNSEDSKGYAVRMLPLTSGHLTVDLAEEPLPLEPQPDQDVFSLLQQIRYQDMEKGKQVQEVGNPSKTSQSVSHQRHRDSGNQYVMMIHREPSLTDRLQFLAQQLDNLRSPDRNQDELKQGGFSHRRPSSFGFPMFRGSSRSEDPIQPVCSLEPMLSMRTQDGIPVEDIQSSSSWQHSSDGARTTPDSSGDVGVGIGSSSKSGHGTSCSGQDHGSEGQVAATGIYPEASYHGDLGGIPEEADELRTCRQGRTSSPNSSRLFCQDFGRDSAVCDCRGEGQGQGKGQSEVRNSSGHGDRVDYHSGVRGGVREAHRDQEGACQGFIRSQREIWSAMTGLRERIRLCDLARQSLTCTTKTSTGGSEVSNASQTGMDVCNTMNVSSTTNVSSHGVTSHSSGVVPTYEEGVDSIEFTTREQSKKNFLTSGTASKIARNMAMTGLAVLTATQGLFTMLTGSVDFMEVACAPNSALGSEFESMGYHIKRINYREGYDLESRKGTSLLRSTVGLTKPRFMWISLPCTRLSPLQNLTERSAEEWAKFQKKMFADLRRAEEVSDSVDDALELGGDFAWEWPTNAVAGWKSKAIQKILRKLRSMGRTVYWCRFHGCAYGLTYNVHCRGTVAQASAYYPTLMVKAISKAVSSMWTSSEESMVLSLARDIEGELLDVEEPIQQQSQLDIFERIREEEPSLFALSRNKFPQEPPTGRRLELIKQQMLRIHRSSGHASFSNLQRLLRVRKAPDWAIRLCGDMQCPDCIEARRPSPPPPSSLKESPDLFEIVGSDVFEFEHQGRKHKLVLWRDRASGLAFVHMLQSYGGPEDETKFWEPSTDHILDSFTRWLMVNPSPTWILTDPATYYTSEQMLEFAGRSGVGVMTTPAESHWMLGAEEGCIGILKMTVERLFKEGLDITVEQAFQLAVHGHNSAIGPSGFSPFQWTRGGMNPETELIAGLNPRKAFGGQLLLKEKARLAYELAAAKFKMSKLNNTVGRHPSSFKPGTLLMLWRQKMRPGKTGGHWIGPVRMLLQEGSTLWLASGSSLIRAKTNQVRECTKRETLQASIQGAVIYKSPVTLSTLLKSFTGKHYTNVTGEVPSQRAIEQDVGGAEVRVEPRRSKIIKTDGMRSRKRKESERPQDPQDADDQGFDDQPVQLPLHQSTSSTSPSLPQEQSQQSTEHRNNPELPDDRAGEQAPEGSLSKALTEKGANAVDGIPTIPSLLADDGCRCSVRDCSLPGGHQGPHEDEAGNKFSWTIYGGRVSLEDDESKSVASSSSSSSSEELMRDEPSSKRDGFHPEATNESLFVLEIPVEQDDARFFMNHPKKAAIWLSKKMKEKGKEHRWQHLSLDQKRNFDEAQAKELSNVLQAKALRSLTQQEWATFDPKQAMQMRWVLTTKTDDSAKARLVVLGYQAHNLTSVQTAAPTMSRISRNMLLTACANLKLKILSGDVTSAFLQASQSLDGDDLYVWAPAELAVLFGADPANPVLPLKIQRAFYGLVNAPRKWYDHLSSTLCSIGWKKLVSDGCIFILCSGDEVVGLCGLHVDDILIGGKEGDEVFEKAMDALKQSYRWGKWEDSSFDYAGCHIQQAKDFSIRIDQNDYTDRWIEEIEIKPERSKQEKSEATPQEVSQLRGLIGSAAWRASQTSPQYQADIGLLLSEIPYATVGTVLRANKLVREMKRTPQSLLFPSWGLPWRQLAILVWADASNHNRPDRSSTMGLVAGCGPANMLAGEPGQVALLQWKSSKTPRQCLGSNGAEVQAITEGEDLCFRLRALLAEIHGVTINRQNLEQIVVQNTQGAVIMDSRGIYDAMTRNVSSLHGLKSTRSGYELALSVSQARSVQTALRWVNGLDQLGDALTKSNSRKVMLRFFSENQWWRLIYDEQFTAGRKLKKRDMEKQMKEAEMTFVSKIAEMARKNRWPWDDVSEPLNPRIMGDELSEIPWTNRYPDMSGI